MKRASTQPVPRAASVRSELKRTWELLVRDPGTTGSRPRDVAHKAAYLYRRDRWRRSLRRRLSSVDGIPVDRPIFLLGVQGGGLTIIGRALRRNAVVVSASGNSSYWTGLDELGTEPSRMRSLPRGLWSCKFRDDLAHPTFGSTHNSAYASDELLPLYRRTAADATAEDAARLKRVLREHLAVYARDPGHARFLDKTQTHTVAVSYLDALLRGCDPHFVLITRNPYALVPSALRRPPSFATPVPREEMLRVFASHWANSLTCALDDAAQVEHFLSVRFEDFVAEPEAVVQRICSFTGLDYDDDMLPRPEHRMPLGTWPGDWKWYPLQPERAVPELDEAGAAIVDAACGALSARLGYTRDGSVRPAEAAVAG